MKPFGFFLGAAVLLLGIVLYSLAIPDHWALGFKPDDWFNLLFLLLVSISALAGVYMVRIYQEAAWIRVALTLAFSATALMTLLSLALTLEPHLMEEWYYMRTVRSFVYVFSLLTSIFTVAAMLNVQAKEIRTPFRWLGWLGILLILADFVMICFTLEHWPHPGVFNTMLLLAVPGRVISIWLNYRFWRGELGRTVGWEKEVETLGEEVS